VHYFKQPSGGDFDLKVDGATVARVSTRADSPGPAHFAFRTTAGKHRIRAQLRGHRPVRLFGIVAETAAPGVVVDTLGIGGARMSGSLRWDERTWVEALRQRQPDLVLFAYGTNEAADRDFSLSRYEGTLRTSLARLRKASPEVSCVLIGPFDLSDQNRARLLEVLDAQRRISREYDCGFWNGYAFMGGARSMRRWASSRPPLASPDYVHLTRLGYVYAGIAIGDALMRAYDQAQGVQAEVASRPSVSECPPVPGGPAAVSIGSRSGGDGDERAH
jgi:lysophospholipase L1-like esterase